MSDRGTQQCAANANANANANDGDRSDIKVLV
jgi:hypothetical protein